MNSGAHQELAQPLVEIPLSSCHLQIQDDQSTGHYQQLKKPTIRDLEVFPPLKLRPATKKFLSTKTLLKIDKTPRKKKTNQKKKKTIQQNNSYAGSIIDLCEDSEAGNSKILAAKPCPEKYDSPLEFFGEPFYPAKTTEEERKKKPITYNCKWCKKQVRGGHNSDANLRKYRDGSNQTGCDGSGCPNQSLAIQAGAKIPPTFDKKILNKILMIWQTRNALPWSRIENFDLQAAFHYFQSDAILFKRKWVASKAKQLYVLLQMLKKSSSKFTLVHDVWTTKGNRYAFIGSSVAYINDD
ncbi:hypothetical protein PGT21_034941 [Puccinia graminis f. sp. tritici]|uniref:Uncharacterized protein n=1 Tax=Puccinia graminis f. sp. tritici TaxID=56615 RepID=A0A5B0PKA6_PUCGR|nr:hypothetical protein PGT21_034941 [Puccinia graminis f. sp. tritici]